MSISGAGYIPRKDFMVLANVSTDATQLWELIGDRIEEMSLKMNPNLETVSDITGYSATTLDRYQVQTEVTPMRAKKESKLFGILYGIVREEKVLSDVEREFLCVSVFDSTETTVDGKQGLVYAAWKQKGIIAVDSFGGGTAGLDIPFSIYWVGAKTHGTFDGTQFAATV